MVSEPPATKEELVLSEPLWVLEATHYSSFDCALKGIYRKATSFDFYPEKKALNRSQLPGKQPYPAMWSSKCLRCQGQLWGVFARPLKGIVPINWTQPCSRESPWDLSCLSGAECQMVNQATKLGVHGSAPLSDGSSMTSLKKCPKCPWLWSHTGLFCELVLMASRGSWHY